MNITKHIVTSANWDTGRAGHSITGIVLHTMVGYMQPSENRFNDPTSQVSVHYGVGMDGSIRQWVEEANTAYQAGNYQVNLNTIGIEHEDWGNYNDAVRTPQLYESSSDLVANICKRYNIPCDTGHILLHKNVIDKTAYPGGTACPDALDTGKIINMAKAKIEGVEEMPNDGDAINFIRIQRGDSTYNPTADELAQAKLKSFKDWAYDLGSPNDGDAINFLTAQGKAVTDASKAAMKKEGFKHWAYAWVGGSAGATELAPGKYIVN